MSVAVPQEHLDDAQKLQADGYVELFTMVLLDSAIVRFKANNTVTWQGNDYEGIPCALTNAGKASSEKNIRPKLVIANPLGVFSKPIQDGVVDGAIVTRTRILKEHLDADLNIFRNQSWAVRHVTARNQQRIELELRDQLDGQFFLVPGRMFIPPEFQQVTLR